MRFHEAFRRRKEKSMSFPLVLIYAFMLHFSHNFEISTVWIRFDLINEIAETSSPVMIETNMDHDIISEYCERHTNDPDSASFLFISVWVGYAPKRKFLRKQSIRLMILSDSLLLVPVFLQMLSSIVTSSILYVFWYHFWQARNSSPGIMCFQEMLFSNRFHVLWTDYLLLDQCTLISPTYFMLCAVRMVLKFRAAMQYYINSFQHWKDDWPWSYIKFHQTSVVFSRRSTVSQSLLSIFRW